MDLERVKYFAVMKTFWVAVGALFCFNTSIAQNNRSTDSDLEFLAYHMVNDSILEHRVAYSDSLKQALIAELQRPKSTSRSFDQLKSIAVTEALDGRFRIFSWQLFISPKEYRHEGIYQSLDKDGAIVVLDDKSTDMFNPHQKDLNADEWYGALYYEIIPFKAKKGTKYLLFGFDGATESENYKIVDVLTIGENDNLIFGAPIFEYAFQEISQTLYRHFHQYDQNVKSVLRYDPSLEMIIFDHLIPWQSKELGGKLTYVPDGSYQGYTLKKGKWQLVDKIFHHVSASPASPDNPLGKKVVENLPR